MRNLDSSKNAIIRCESELIHHFGQLLHEDPDLSWQSPPGESAQNRLSWIELNLDGQSRRFKPVYSLKPSIPELKSILATWTDEFPPILVAPELTSRILDFCRQERLAAVDLNGRAYVRSPGLLVDRRNLPGRDFRFELEPRNVFVGKSARIIRSLLTDRDRIWTQGELVERTKASSGLVSRIIQHLISQGFIEKQSPRELKLCDPMSLIDAWVKRDDFNRRASTTRFAVFGNDPFAVAQQLANWADSQAVPIAFTQWIGAWLRHPYTEPLIASAYVSRLPEPATLESLAMRPVSEAGKVWLHVPNEEGVFLETRCVQGLPLASDAQIYLDLQNTGLRGPDQADALRHWEGFCRP